MAKNLNDDEVYSSDQILLSQKEKNIDSLAHVRDVYFQF